MAKQNGFQKFLRKMIPVVDGIIEKVKKMHVHFSKIEYGAKGEIKHLTFEDQKYGPNFENLSPSLLVLQTAFVETLDEST